MGIKACGILRILLKDASSFVQPVTTTLDGSGRLRGVSVAVWQPRPRHLRWPTESVS